MILFWRIRVKKFFFCIVLFILFSTAFCFEQESYNEILGKRNVITRFQDYNLPNIQGNYISYTNRIRAFTIDDRTVFFYQVMRETDKIITTITLSEKELADTLTKMNVLNSSFILDKEKKADYIENKIVTETGVEIGYFASAVSSGWFIDFNEGRTSKLIILYQDNELFNALQIAAKKIIELSIKGVQ